MSIGLDHTLHYSSGANNALLLDSVFTHELTTIAPVRDASNPGCHPLNENVLNAAHLLAPPSLLCQVSAATRHLCESVVLSAEDHQRLHLSTGLYHTRQHSGGAIPIPPTAPGQLLHVQAAMSSAAPAHHGVPVILAAT
ncbi:hypothetical protein MTO96_013245 [Rhipicephalus appendiculatus]